MLYWCFTIHNILSNICCVGAKHVVLGGLPYTTYFQTYVVLEVKHVVLEVYHTQHIFKHMLRVNHFSDQIVMLVGQTHKGI